MTQPPTPGNRIAAVVIVGAMIMAALILRLTGAPQAIFDHYASSGNTPFDELDASLPNSQEVAEAFRPRLGSQQIVADDYSSVSADSQVVSFIVSKPAGSGPFPAVVIVHSGTSGEVMTSQVGAGLGAQLSQQLGVVTVTINWRNDGFGDGAVADVVGVVNWLGLQTDVDSDQVILLGTGQGAYIAVRSSRELGPVPLILTNPFIDILYQYQFLREQDAPSADQLLRQTNCHQVVDQNACLSALSLGESVSASPQPLLLIRASADQTTSTEQVDLIESLAQHVQRVDISDGSAAHNFLEQPGAAGFADGLASIQDWYSSLNN